MAMWAALDALIKVVPRATARPVCPALARGFSGVAGLVAAGEGGTHADHMPGRETLSRDKRASLAVARGRHTAS